MVSYKEMGDYRAHDTRHSSLSDQLRGEADHYSTIYDLRPCTNYTYYVSAVSLYGLQGGTRSARGSTGETGKNVHEWQSREMEKGGWQLRGFVAQ